MGHGCFAANSSCKYHNAHVQIPCLHGRLGFSVGVSVHLEDVQITSLFSGAGRGRSVHLTLVCLRRHMGAADCYVLTVGVLKPFNKASWACVGFRTAAFSSSSCQVLVLSFLNNTSLFFRLLIPLLQIWFNQPSRWPNLLIFLNSLSRPYGSPSLNHSLFSNCILTHFFASLHASTWLYSSASTGNSWGGAFARRFPVSFWEN